MRSIFLTHLHADHIMDLANVFVGAGRRPTSTSWARPPPDCPSRRSCPTPTAARVPRRPRTGHEATIELLLRAFAYNINLRAQDEGRAPSPAVRVREMGVRRDGYVPDIDLGVTGDGSSPAAAAPTWSRS